MATTNWRLSDQAVDENMGYANKSSTSIALASLCNEDNLAAEPESGHPYRVRVVGCPIRGLTPVAIVLEDLDRCFDGDFTALSNYVLKMCLSLKPCIDYRYVQFYLYRYSNHFWPYFSVFQLLCINRKHFFFVM